MGSYLITEDDEVEEDEELETEGEIAAFCAKCEGEIELTEEVFLFTIVQPFVTENGLVFVEHDHNGNLLEEPAFYDFACWEETLEEAQEACEDVPPVQHADGLLCCDICESDILAGETMAIETFGEIHWSDRCPSNVPTHTFMPMAESKHICLACIGAMNMDHVRLNYLDQLRVSAEQPLQHLCMTGLHGRCWRPEYFHSLDSSCNNCPHKK